MFFKISKSGGKTVQTSSQIKLFFLNFRTVSTYFGPHTQKVKKSTIFKKYGHFC